MNIKSVIFDLDGTLVDSVQDIADAMNKMLANNEFPQHDVAAYKLFVGNGIRKLVERALPKTKQNDETINRCFNEMMEIYRTNFVEKSTLYPGIAEMLDGLTMRNIKMAILSNKADEFVSKVVEVLLPNWEFESVLGLTSEADKKPNPKFPLQMAQQMGIHPSEMVFMGDSSVDMQTATNAHMIPVGVLWGFRTKEEILAHGAQYVLEKPEDFLQLLDEE